MTSHAWRALEMLALGGMSETGIRPTSWHLRSCSLWNVNIKIIICKTVFWRRIKELVSACLAENISAIGLIKIIHFTAIDAMHCLTKSFIARCKFWDKMNGSHDMLLVNSKYRTDHNLPINIECHQFFGIQRQLILSANLNKYLRKKSAEMSTNISHFTHFPRGA